MRTLNEYLELPYKLEIVADKDEAKTSCTTSSASAAQLQLW